MVSDEVAREPHSAPPVGRWRCSLTVPATAKREYPPDAGNRTSGLFLGELARLCAALFSTLLCRRGREFQRASGKSQVNVLGRLISLDHSEGGY